MEDKKYYHNPGRNFFTGECRGTVPSSPQRAFTRPSALCFDEQQLMRVALAVYAVIHVGRAPTTSESESLSHADPRPLAFKSGESG